MWTSSAEQIAISVPIDGLVLPRSTRLSIDIDRPVASASARSGMPFIVRTSRMRVPISAIASSALSPSAVLGRRLFRQCESPVPRVRAQSSPIRVSGQGGGKSRCLSRIKMI